MARKGLNEKKVVAIVKNETPFEAPSTLTNDQKKIWDAVVKRLGNDYFPVEVHNLLEQYCKHIQSSQKIGKMIDDLEAQNKLDFFDDAFLKKYKTITEMRDKEVRAASSLATRLRITTQSTTKGDRHSKPLSTPKPWEVGDV